MHTFQLTYSAFLFPAIPLMMLTFGNRWIALSTLIRKVHAELFDQKFSTNKESTKKYLSQIKVLNKRLRYVKLMQFFSGLSFLFNLLTIMIGMIDLRWGLFLFILALIFFSAAIFLFLIEIQISSKALKTHLQDLEEIEISKASLKSKK